MRRAALALVLVAACGGAPRGKTAPPPSTGPGAAEIDATTHASRHAWASAGARAGREAELIRKAPAAAVLRVVRVDDECSNAGGTHLTLEVVELVKGAGFRSVAGGGHAFWITAKPGDVFAGGVGPPDGNPRKDNPGWCLNGLPTVDGYATILMAAPTVEAASEKLREILAR